MVECYNELPDWIVALIVFWTPVVLFAATVIVGKLMKSLIIRKQHEKISM